MFSGCIPLDPQLTLSLEHGENFLDLYPQSHAKIAMDGVIKQIMNKTEPSG